MLPRNARLTSPNDFARTTKSGYRLASNALVVYLYATKEDLPSRCGLIVGKSVGGSVTRHRISRQLRHLLHDRLEEIPKGSFVVVRALANSAKVSAAELKNQFTSTLTKLIEKSSVAQ